MAHQVCHVLLVISTENKKPQAKTLGVFISKIEAKKALVAVYTGNKAHNWQWVKEEQAYRTHDSMLRIQEFTLSENVGVKEKCWVAVSLTFGEGVGWKADVETLNTSPQEAVQAVEQLIENSGQEWQKTDGAFKWRTGTVHGKTGWRGVKIFRSSFQ